MIGAVIRKDIRLSAIGLAAQMVVMAIPPTLYGAYLIVNPDRWPRGSAEWRVDLSNVCWFMAGGCLLLVTPVLGTIPMARERRERSCDLLTTAPIGRHVHIFSKLGVFVAASSLAPALCLLAAATLTDASKPFESLILHRESFIAMVMAFAALGGMSWFMGSFMRSEAIAAGFTYLIVLSTVVSWALLTERYRILGEQAMGWYMAIMGAICIAGLVLGTAVALVRRVW